MHRNMVTQLMICRFYVEPAALGCVGERASTGSVHEDGGELRGLRPQESRWRLPPHPNLAETRALLRNQLPNRLHKFRRQHVLSLLFPAGADVYPPRLGLFI